MTSKFNDLAQEERRRRIAWLALMPLVWLQLTVAVHQFDHAAGYVDYSCQVCIQLDRVDAVVDDASVVSPHAIFAIPAPNPPAEVVTRASVRGFDSRAPPNL